MIRIHKTGMFKVSEMAQGKMKLLAGNSNPELARKISSFLDVPLTKAEVDTFPDGETHIKILDDVRGSDVFVIQSVCPPVNENLMELLIMIDCLRRASADRITAVIPYYGYARQDRKDEGRVPISAKLVANLLTTAGADRILTMDLHAEQIQGFFDIPVDNMYANLLFLSYLKKKNVTEDMVILAPDVGASKRSGFYAKWLHAPLAILDKRRKSGSEVTLMAIIGSVEGKDVLIPDDMISTGGSMVQAVNVAKENGAKDIYIAATHALFAGNALEKFKGLDVKEIVISDTIPVSSEKSLPAMTILSTAEVFAKAIKRIHSGESLSALFKIDDATEQPSLF